LNRQGKEVNLSISDNGVGCDMSVVKKGMGIMNIMSRADHYHGRVGIVTNPGEGYALEVVLSLP